MCYIALVEGDKHTKVYFLCKETRATETFCKKKITSVHLRCSQT
jgi:hypothetical protein